MSPESLLLYISTVAVASIIPGPSMLLALSHGIRYGARKTILSAAGNVTASLLQAGISLAGLSIILSGSELLFRGVKYAGALYLIWLGIRSFMNRSSQNAQKEDESGIKGNRLFTQAFIVAFCNPKAILFFTALFPQVISRDAATPLGYLFLMSLLALIAFFCFMMYAVFGGRLTRFLKAEKRQRIFNRTIGILFSGLGGSVILSDLS